MGATAVFKILANLHDPQTLADIYHEDPDTFKKLQIYYPHWKEMANRYNPYLLKQLKDLGVPID